jgi:hypothetical protein
MGIFKNLINKILDIEAPPVVERLVKKELAKKGATGGNPLDAAPFSMKIEDVFSIPGRGTVATGKIEVGSIKLNDEIMIISESQKKIAKVVGIELFNKMVGEAKSGDSVGLLLDKIKQNEVKRGYIATKYENAGFKEIADDSKEAIQIREAQQQRRNTILNGMIIQIEKSPYFKPEKKQSLIETLKKTSKLQDPFSYDDCLAVTEKKALGLNTKLKISRQMIDFLNDEGLKLENPKEIIGAIYRGVCSKESALESQKRMQSLGLKFYVWETSGDERVCKACEVMDGKLCRWDDTTISSEDDGKTWRRRPEGAILMHPGHHECCSGYYENCRCTAITYYPEIAGEL